MTVAVGTAWHAEPYSYAEARVLAGALGLSHTTASILLRRGFRDPAAARRFLEADESHRPLEMGGMAEAVALLLGHVNDGSQIAVHGDYDVDGVCSTALLVRTLEKLGANVRARLPSRHEDGYGLSAATVEELHRGGARLLVTVDCGIGAVAEVAAARALGMDVVVTDHHRPGEQLPDCPIVHPALGGYPCADLCATGVTFKLCQALFEAAGSDPEELDEDLDLVALATIADVVPLLGENRALTRRGLRALAGTQKPGLRALMAVAGIEPQAADERKVAFGLAPRINAAGRLYRPDAALELLLTTDEPRAREVARELDAVNTERRAVETRIAFEAEGQVAQARERGDQPLFVLAGEDWHSGVVGIVASRLVERHHRPFVLVALDADGRGRGSGRSIGPYDLHAGLAACERHLLRFGGHRMAAGLEIDAAAIEGFRSDLVAHAATRLGPDDLVQVERVDAVVPGDAVSHALAEELERLRPFGMGNPGPNLLVPAARVSDVRAIGEGRHASFSVRSAGVRTRAVAFGIGGSLPGGGDEEARHDLVGRLEMNEWRGAVEPRIVLRSLHPVEPEAPATERPTCAACACRARGSDWWEAVTCELERSLERPSEETGSHREVVDLRGSGIVGSLGDLLSSGDSVAVLCADVSRRRSLLEVDLPAVRFGRGAVTIASARCSSGALERLRSAGEGPRATALVDYASALADPSALASHTHLFALDPPPGQWALRALRAGAKRDEKGFVVLAWGAAEVELARKALDHEYGLRPSLAAVYGSLRGLLDGVAGEELERLLSGEGRHPRSPAVVGRCLRILRELKLVAIEPSGATVRCTADGPRGDGAARVQLERSATFSAFSELHREGQAFLDRQIQAMSGARAA